MQITAMMRSKKPFMSVSVLRCRLVDGARAPLVADVAHVSPSAESLALLGLSDRNPSRGCSTSWRGRSSTVRRQCVSRRASARRLGGSSTQSLDAARTFFSDDGGFFNNGARIYRADERRLLDALARDGRTQPADRRADLALENVCSAEAVQRAIEGLRRWPQSSSR